MYTVITEACFDAAHFLAGYEGKCRNLHGHRWRVLIEVAKEELGKNSMVVDFTALKKALKQLVDGFDHCMVIEKNSLKAKTYEALKEEEFCIVEVPFRPTAECFARYFYEEMTQMGYPVRCVKVYETPNNCAVYEA